MMDRMRFGEAADMLDARYDFERKSEFMGRKEESLRELYHFCRDQERKPAEASHTLRVKYDKDDNIVSFNFGGIEVDHGNLEAFSVFVISSPQSKVAEMAAELCTLLRKRAPSRSNPNFECAAERIYNTWSDQPGFVPWVPGGNSDKQDEARRLAAAAPAPQTDVPVRHFADNRIERSEEQIGDAS